MIRRKYINHCGLIGLMRPICGFLAAVGMLLMAALCLSLASEPASAASTAGFQPGNIISDAVMGNYNSMSIDDIQRFLTSKNNCGNRNEALWRQLENQYPNRDWHFQNGHFVCLSEERFGNTWTEIGWGETAAEIIYHAAQDFRINPQVLIVLLQKEQGLITDQYPNNYDYRSATGYGCPDTAACDSKYYGFKNQVRLAAQMFRTVLDGGWSNYPAYRTTYVQYNPNRSCGGTNVYIENRATSALYRYTPYQPNASALAAGYGVGDACGAYGNRNFYLYFSDWFGDAWNKSYGDSVNLLEGEYAFLSHAFEVGDMTTASGNNSGTNVEFAKRNMTDVHDKWRLKKTNDGYYIFIHQPTKLALDLNMETQNLALWSEHGDKNQKWKLYAAEGDQLVIESVSSPGKVITIEQGGNIDVQPYSGSKQQQWQLFVGKTLDDGLYTVSSQANKSSVIDANGINDGNNVTVWGAHGDSNQEWVANYDSSSDTYTLTNPLTGKRLDLTGAVAKINGNIELWAANYSCAQKWKLIPRGQHYILLSACSVGYALDLYNGDASNGSNIQVYPTHNNGPQQWSFKAVSDAPTAGRAYLISAKSTPTSVVDMDGNNHNAMLWPRHGGWNQKWKLVYNSKTDDYTLINPTNGHAFDVDNSSMNAGTNVLTWVHHAACNQRWKIRRTKDGYYEILSACDNNYALDMFGGYTTIGTNLQLWPRHSGDAQKFSFSFAH